MSVNKPKSSGPRTSDIIGFKFKHIRTKQQKVQASYITNKYIDHGNILIMKIFVNSNASLDCLHSKDMVLYARLNLPESML